MEKAAQKKQESQLKKEQDRKMANKTKSRTIVEDKWERKKYIQECDSDMIKIRLHIWQVYCNYKRDNAETKCLLCKKLEDTTVHVLECEKAKKFTLNKENSNREWEEITDIEKLKRREKLEKRTK